MFADINAAVNQAASMLRSGSEVINMANLDDTLGLGRVRAHASNIAGDLQEMGITVHEIIGGLDEYPVVGDKVNRLIKEKYNDFDFAVITGVPHAISMDNLQGMEIFSVTNGPRQVLPLKEMGHDHVIVEIDLHPKTLGVSHIVESDFGATLREIAKEEST